MSRRRHFGAVRKRASGRWQATYWSDGHSHSVGTFAVKADALAYLSTIEADLRRGVWIDPRAGQVLTCNFADEWLARRHDLSERTSELYRYLLDRHVYPTLGRVALAGLTPSMIRAWHANIADEHPSTAAKAYRLLSTILRTAVSDGLILNSPCRVKGAATEHAAERPIATVAEVEALSNAMPEHLRLTVLLATWCQLRRGEVLGLRRQDIDLLHGNIHIEQSRTFTRDGSSLTKSPKTAAGRRTLTAPRQVVGAIEEHLNHFTPDAPEALVFSNSVGIPTSAAALQRAWNKSRWLVGRPELHFHDLRHTGLTLAAATGATTAELMHRAGHASPSAALRYQHATQDRDRIVAEALEHLIRPAPVIEIITSVAK